MTRVKVYVGNLAFELVARDIEDVFSRFGRIDHVSLKRGFAFLLFDDIRDAETAVKEMDNVMLHGRRIKVEFASGVPNTGYKSNGDSDRRAPRSGDYGSSSNVNASSSRDSSKSLFVGNIPPHLKMRELEDYFDSFGKVMNVKILPQARGNAAISAFVDFADAADAKRAHESGMEIAGQRLRTDYNVRRRESSSTDANDDRRSSRGSRYDESSRSGYDRRERSRSPARRERSRSPARRERSRSPARRERSRSPARRERSRSPVRRERSRSPVRRERSRSPARSRERSRSPVRERRDDRSPPRSTSSRSDRDARRESPPRSPPRFREDAPARSNGTDDDQSRRSP